MACKGSNILTVFFLYELWKFLFTVLYVLNTDISYHNLVKAWDQRGSKATLELLVPNTEYLPQFPFMLLDF
jgi:hypothetical protein